MHARERARREWCRVLALESRSQPTSEMVLQAYSADKYLEEQNLEIPLYWS